MRAQNMSHPIRFQEFVHDTRAKCVASATMEHPIKPLESSGREKVDGYLTEVILQNPPSQDRGPTKQGRPWALRVVFLMRGAGKRITRPGMTCGCKPRNRSTTLIWSIE